jgi:hypothetical protein
MSDADLLLLARGWRAYAEELLLRAKTMHDAVARLKIHELADGYQRLARQVEQGAGVPVRG